MNAQNLQKVQQMRLSNDRLQLIQLAMKYLKLKNEGFLNNFEQSQTWNKISSGFIMNGKQISLKSMIDFKICPIKTPQQTYFNPFQKKPITICYNKIDDQQKFQQLLSYNMILLYDTKTKGLENQNWNKISDTVYSTVRALNIAKICYKGQFYCFKKQIQERVLSRERFKGTKFQEEDLRQIYEKAVADTSPISQIINYQHRTDLFNRIEQ